VNRRFEQTFGVQRTDVVGKTDYQVLGRVQARTFRAGDRTVLLGGRPKQTEETTGGPPNERTWLVTRFPIRDEDGEPRAIGGIATDITDRARVEAEIRRYRDHLEDLVSERTRDLQQVRDELLKANRELEKARAAAEAAAEAKGRFLATMSHEIRTPMNAMVALVSLVLESDLSAEQRAHLETALHGAQGLLRIINDILEYSKLEAEHLTLELRPFRLQSLLVELGDMYRALSMAKGITFRLDAAEDLPVAVLGDVDRIRQILSNLLSNALKFTHKGEIRLSVSMSSEEPVGRVRFDVTDTGIGVPPDKQQVIFGEFHQADQSVTRKYGGTGLGLSISRRIAEQLGGQLTLQSEPGKGSTFTLLLPLPESNEDMLPPEPARRTSHQARRRAQASPSRQPDLTSPGCWSWRTTHSTRRSHRPSSFGSIVRWTYAAMARRHWRASASRMLTPPHRRCHHTTSCSWTGRCPCWTASAPHDSFGNGCQLAVSCPLWA